MLKRIIGYLFIVIAVLFTLTIVFKIPHILGILVDSILVLDGTMDDYQTGVVFGKSLYWIVHIGITILLWIYGIRWRKATNMR